MLPNMVVIKESTQREISDLNTTITKRDETVLKPDAPQSLEKVLFPRVEASVNAHIH